MPVPDGNVLGIIAGQPSHLLKMIPQKAMASEKSQMVSPVNLFGPGPIGI